jgi:hypothetical protein
MSTRSFITNDGHDLVVPCCCEPRTLVDDGAAGNSLQCVIQKSTDQAAIDFTSPFGGTKLQAATGPGVGVGHGDVPNKASGESLDVFSTSCSMGDPHKRASAVDHNRAQLHGGDALCGGHAGESDAAGQLVHAVADDCEAGGDITSCPFSWACNSRITDDCERFKFDPPPGYVYDNTEVCSFNDADVLGRTGQTMDLEWLLNNTDGPGRLGCSYRYRKDWNDSRWGAPRDWGSGEWGGSGSQAREEFISEAYLHPFRGAPNNLDNEYLRVTNLIVAARNESMTPSVEVFNENKIPIKRMECCIGGPGYTASSCPVNTDLYDWSLGGSTTSSVQPQQQANIDRSDDDIEAYVPEGNMCNGTVDGRVDTPQSWCSYNILHAAGPDFDGMQFNPHHFNLYRFDEYWDLLSDDSCNEWTDKDTETITTRKTALVTKLAPFYAWISHELAAKETYGDDFPWTPYGPEIVIPNPHSLSEAYNAVLAATQTTPTFRQVIGQPDGEETWRYGPFTCPVSRADLPPRRWASDPPCAMHERVDLDPTPAYPFQKFETRGYNDDFNNPDPSFGNGRLYYGGAGQDGQGEKHKFPMDLRAPSIRPGNDIRDEDGSIKFRTENARYLALVNLLSHPRTQDFIKYIDEDNADWTTFKTNMKTFCNRSDIFNFPDTSVASGASDEERAHKEKLKDKYEPLCACFWDATNGSTTPYNPARDEATIGDTISALDASSGPVTAGDGATEVTAHSLVAQALNDHKAEIIAGTLKNECWYSGCLRQSQRATDNTVDGITFSRIFNPYRNAAHGAEATTCPSICLSSCMATADVSVGSVTGGSTVTVEANAIIDCSARCTDGTHVPGGGGDGIGSGGQPSPKPEPPPPPLPPPPPSPPPPTETTSIINKLSIARKKLTEKISDLHPGMIIGIIIALLVLVGLVLWKKESILGLLKSDE